MKKFLIPEAALGQHALLLGKTRSGKSSKMRLIVEHFLDQKIPVCVIDPKGDWWGLKSSADGKKAGYPIIIFGTEHARHADIRINARSGAGVAELVATGNRPCLIDLRGMRVGERAQFFIDFASTFFTHARGHRVLAIDEVHNFAPQGKIPDPQTGEMLHWANRLISEGAGMGITMLSASQRPQKVHKDYVTSHETLIATRVIHKLDREAIKDWIDACGDPALGREVLGSLAGMQRAEAWVYSPEAGFGPEQLTFPLFKTFDSFKPQSDKAPAKLKGWAQVDLVEVQGKLTKVIEEAKANDPKELKKRIAELEQRLKKAPPAPATDPADIGMAELRGYKRGLQECAVAYGAFAKILGLIQAPLERAIADTEKRHAIVVEQLQKSGQQAVKQAAVDAPKREPAASAGNARKSSPAPAGGDGDVSGPEQKILDAIRWWNVLGIAAPSHAQTAFIAGYSHKSGSWATYLSRLRTKGLIEGRGDLVLTDQGAAIAAEPETPPSTEALHRAVLGKIDGPMQRILGPLLEAYPNGLSHLEAAEKAGYSHQSGSWATYLSRLRSLDLIAGRGELKAEPWLFAA
ncbi:DUF87 domain-containing protein [Bradyrhizobium sp. 192]|uniref:helicase HerA domain-containing protein n=1 Tax=Bradyrhizobium sp. 192 TaxID=2782660 RepID=UPI001FFE9BDC|nr:DUF87 domain-containing protein [Bradyrhizobium sp. 192]UPJ55386.1 DUF87 domain-containing protein [Bradyrhizobium sp. 192]